MIPNAPDRIPMSKDLTSEILGLSFVWMEGDSERFRLYFGEGQLQWCLDLLASENHINVEIEENAAIDETFLPHFVIGYGSDHPLERLVGHHIVSARTDQRRRIALRWSNAAITTVKLDKGRLWLRMQVA